PISLINVIADVIGTLMPGPVDETTPVAILTVPRLREGLTRLLVEVFECLFPPMVITTDGETGLICNISTYMLILATISHCPGSPAPSPSDTAPCTAVF